MLEKDCVKLHLEIIIAISKKKEEPEWMTEWRLDAFKKWKEMSEPEWANVKYCSKRCRSMKKEVL